MSRASGSVEAESQAPSDANDVIGSRNRLGSGSVSGFRDVACDRCTRPAVFRCCRCSSQLHRDKDTDIRFFLRIAVSGDQAILVDDVRTRVTRTPQLQVLFKSRLSCYSANKRSHCATTEQDMKSLHAPTRRSHGKRSSGQFSP